MPPPVTRSSRLAAAPGNARVTLSWAAVTNASSYNLYRGATSTSLTLHRVGLTGTNHADTGLTNGTAYHYQLAAVNSNGQGTKTVTKSATPLASYLPPAAPTNLAATGGDGKVTLSWGAVTGATSYTLKRSTANGGPYTAVATGLTGTGYVDPGLVNGLTFYYVLTAVSNNGESANSNQATATTQGVVLTAVGGNGLVGLQWPCGTNSNVGYFSVLRATSPGGPYTTIQTNLKNYPGDDIGFRDTDVVNGTTYYYVVAATYPIGSLAVWSSNYAAATPSASAQNDPAPDDRFEVFAGDGRFMTQWPAQGGQGYLIWHSTTPGGPYQLLSNTYVFDYGVWVTMLTSGVPNGVTKYLVLSTFFSGNSPEISVTPHAGVALTKLSFYPSPVGGGEDVNINAELDAMAPAGDAQVILSSSNPAVLPLPPSLTIYHERTYNWLWVTTAAVTAPTNVTVTASYGGVTKTIVVPVVPRVMENVYVGPVVAGGPPSVGTVTLYQPAPVGGAVVQLSVTANQPQSLYNVTAPSSVTVPAGRTTATFPVTCTSATGQEYGKEWKSFLLTATYNGHPKGCNFLASGNFVAGISASPSSVTSGGTSTGTVTLEAPAGTGGMVVTLSKTSSNGNASVVTLPASVTVPSGQVSASFNIQTQGATVATDVVLHAATGGTGPGAYTVDFYSLHIEPSTVAIQSLDLAPNPVVAGNDVSATLQLNGAAGTGGMEVTLTSNNPAAPVPASVNIPAGQNAISIVIPTQGIDTATATALITARANGVTLQRSLTLNRLAPPSPLSASAGNRRVKLNWSAVEGATRGYNVKRSNTAGGPYTVVAGNVGGTTYTDEGLTNGQTYYYVATSVAPHAESENSNEEGADGNTTPFGVNPPLILRATSENDSVLLEWNAPSGTPPTSYTAKRALLSGGPYMTIGILTVPAVAAGYTWTIDDDTAVNETPYYYL